MSFGQTNGRPDRDTIVTSEPVLSHSLLNQYTTASSSGDPVVSSLFSGNKYPSFPISALFLTQFDVKSGYELKWIKTVSEDVNIKGLEYKSLPSGLHEVEQDVISFIQPFKVENDENTTTAQSTDLRDLYYGVSVFHQNLGESRNEDRSSVKMFSLGILVDPSRIDTTSGYAWKSLSFTSALQYVELLKTLLSSWDMESFEAFEDFFERHSQFNEELKDNNSSNSLHSSPTPAPVVFPSLVDKDMKILKQTEQSSNHFILKLPELIKVFGPLIFQVWRHAMLRERIILLDSHEINLNDSFVYNISILSTIPQHLQRILIESGCNESRLFKMNNLQPLYTVGINDLDWLKNLPFDECQGQIAFSTDEILLYKTQIYDLSIQLHSEVLTPSDVSHSPKLLTAKQSSPGSRHPTPIKATQRDLRRARFIRSKLLQYEEEEGEESPGDDPQWWNNVTIPPTWKQIAWSSFFFWASSGEPFPFTSNPSSLIHESEHFDQLKDAAEEEGEEEGNQFKDTVDEALFIVGYFQSLTSRLLMHVSQMLTNYESSCCSSAPVSSSLIQEVELVLEFSDLQQMGLDPYHCEDWNFARDIIMKYWGGENGKVKSVRFGAALSLCCFN